MFSKLGTVRGDWGGCGDPLAPPLPCLRHNFSISNAERLRGGSEILRGISRTLSSAVSLWTGEHHATHTD